MYTRIKADLSAPLPPSVARLVGINAGDVVDVRVEDGRVILERAAADTRNAELRSLQAGLSEWDSADDDEAFGHL